MVFNISQKINKRITWRKGNEKSCVQTMMSSLLQQLKSNVRKVKERHCKQLKGIWCTVCSWCWIVLFTLSRSPQSSKGGKVTGNKPRSGLIRPYTGRMWGAICEGRVLEMHDNVTLPLTRHCCCSTCAWISTWRSPRHCRWSCPSLGPADPETSCPQATWVECQTVS